MQELITKSNVYFAEVQGEGVILDLLGDTYYGIDGIGARIWKAVSKLEQNGIAETKVRLQEELGVPASEIDDAISQLAKLLKDLNLTPENDDLASSLPTPLPPSKAKPSSKRLDSRTLDRTKVRAWLVTKSMIIMLWSTYMIRHKRAMDLLTRLPPTPDGNLSAHESPFENDPVIYEVRKAVGVIRSLFTRGNPDCVARSVTIATLLRQYGIKAEICLGVQKFPFEAHAWVESEGVVVCTSNPSRISKYTVIARF